MPSIRLLMERVSSALQPQFANFRKLRSAITARQTFAGGKLRELTQLVEKLNDDRTRLALDFDEKAFNEVMKTSTRIRDLQTATDVLGNNAAVERLKYSDEAIATYVVGLEHLAGAFSDRLDKMHAETQRLNAEMGVDGSEDSPATSAVGNEFSRINSIISDLRSLGTKDEKGISGDANRMAACSAAFSILDQYAK